MQIKPIISAASLRDEIKKKMTDTTTTNGKLIFTRDDIWTTPDFFARVIRMYCVENSVTFEQLADLYRKYGTAIYLTSDQISQGIGNIKRTFLASEVTKKSFVKFCAIMDIDVIDMALTLKSNNNKVVTYTLNESYPGYFIEMDKNFDERTVWSEDKPKQRCKFSDRED